MSDLHYIFSLSGTSDDNLSPLDIDDEEEKAKAAGQKPEVKPSEIIRAVLTPSDDGRGRGQITYSMLGTNRNINTFELRIVKSEEDDCQLSEIVSFTYENETTDDAIEVVLSLAPEKFDKLSLLINTRIVNGASWTLSGAAGDCSRRVLRGGSWYYVPGDLRSSKRSGNYSDNRIIIYGFRVARTLP